MSSVDRSEPISTLLYDAVCALAGRCDGAAKQDMAGFNKIDVPLGHSLASRPLGSWSYKQAGAAYQMIAKYRGQLMRMGIDYDKIPKPRTPEGSTPPPRSLLLTTDSKRLVFRFQYDAGLVASIKTLE